MPRDNQTEVEQRRDEALRLALNTRPKQHNDMKKGTRKKRPDDRPTASEKRTQPAGTERSDC